MRWWKRRWRGRSRRWSASRLPKAKSSARTSQDHEFQGLFDQAAVDARAGRRRPRHSPHTLRRAGRVLRPERTQARAPAPSNELQITPETKTRNSAELEIRNLHVEVEDKKILDGLDLDVEKGKVHALMGPNGSGKSTLANVTMGHPALDGSEGTITFKAKRGRSRGRPRGPLAGRPLHGLPDPVVSPAPRSASMRMIINAQREARGEDQIKIEDSPAPPRRRWSWRTSERLLQPLPQRGLLRRREEADGAAAAGVAAAGDRGPRRDRLGLDIDALRPSRGRQQVRRPPTWAS